MPPERAKPLRTPGSVLVGPSTVGALWHRRRRQSQPRRPFRRHPLPLRQGADITPHFHLGGLIGWRHRWVPVPVGRPVGHVGARHRRRRRPARQTRTSQRSVSVQPAIREPDQRALDRNAAWSPRLRGRQVAVLRNWRRVRGRAWKRRLGMGAASRRPASAARLSPPVAVLRSSDHFPRLPLPRPLASRASTTGRPWSATP